MVQVIVLFSVLALPVHPATKAEDVKLVSESAPVLFDLGSAVPQFTFLPSFTSGALLVRHRAGPSDPQYSVYSRDGKLLARFRIDIPGARETIGSRIAPMRDGSGYVAAVIAVNGAERVPTLCFLDRGGKLQHVVRTSPLWANHIAVATDGAIWGFGPAGPEDNPTSEDPVLFHFSSTGELLETALPRNLFGQEPPFELSTQLGQAVLTAGGNRVVVYSPHTRQLFEVALDGRVAGSYVIPLPEQRYPGQSPSRPMAVAGLAVTERDVIYARLSGGENTGIYELDRLNQRWVPLPPDLMEKVRVYSLIGSEGEQLALTPVGLRGQVFAVKWLHLSPRFTP